MEPINYLKIISLIIASHATESFIQAKLPNRSKKELEKDLERRSEVLIIRSIIMIESIKEDWPIAMCGSITIVISILVIIMRLNIIKIIA